MKKWIIAVIFGIVMSWVNVYLSSMLHSFLKKEFEGINTLKFADCLAGISQNKDHFTIFICIEVFILLGIGLLLLNRFGDYKSKMQRITPEITTPVASGEKQHGSSRWLGKSEYKKAFKTIVIDKDSEKIKYLIDCGRSDYNKIQQLIKEQKEADRKGRRKI